MSKVYRLITALLISFLALLGTANAYDFVPTDAEWQSWPGYCKAKYIWTPIGENSKFVRSVGPRDRADLSKWENAGVFGVHHFCAGKLWAQRAKLEKSKTQKSWMYDQAWGETAFTANRSDRSSPLFTEIALVQSMIMFEQDRADEAIQLLIDRTQEHPRGDVLYSAIAIMQRKTGQLDQARQSLVRGNIATNGDSAEINYNLGLLSLELGDIDDARQYADNAYRLGFPLPGLRAKLDRIGLGQ